MPPIPPIGEIQEIIHGEVVREVRREIESFRYSERRMAEYQRFQNEYSIYGGYDSSPTPEPPRRNVRELQIDRERLRIQMEGLIPGVPFTPANTVANTNQATVPKDVVKEVTKPKLVFGNTIQDTLEI